ncbi:MAG: heparinase II/III family protein [Fimbriimonadaceae bacterium]|nr:heparinase II/III family protein [Fimbriimonadaceae bacterium]
MSPPVSCCLCATGLLLTAGLALGAPSAERVRQIAAWLPEQPRGWGPPLTDRAAWDRLAATPAGQQAIARAAALLRQALPAQPDELYLEFSRNGNRTRWQDVAFARRGRLHTLVLGECLERRGRFVAPCEELLRAVAAERCWVLPAHDTRLANFEGQATEVDLASSALGWDLAQAAWLLGEDLPAASRELLRREVTRRVIQPYRRLIDGQERIFWFSATHNWNAVCHAGCVGATLALLPSRDDRALAVAAAEEQIRRFYSGFTADGYCSEGLGYWNYGFGRYLMLAEMVFQATAGRLDLLADPAARAPALFGGNIEICDGVYPAFADCGVNARPDDLATTSIAQRFGLAPVAAPAPELLLGSLVTTALYAFGSSWSQPLPAVAPDQRLRTWFEQAGILIARPTGGSSFGVALKGGHNAEHHNHNDVGSYVVAAGGRPVLADPGAETYTARTFSAKRYDSRLLNSYGHPVPVVAGQLQRSGAEARGQVLSTAFTAERDTLRLDLRSCYTVPELQKLERTFVYDRRDGGSLSITDEVAYSSPQAFETALITLGGYQERGPQTLLLWNVDQAVEATITADVPLQRRSEVIVEDAPVRPTRIGLATTAAVRSATITVRVTPVVDADPAVLRNGDFELGSFGWSIPADGLAAVATDRTLDGSRGSLRITDQDLQRGTNITSGRRPVRPASKYRLQGQIYTVSGSGVGLYIYCFDAAGKPVSPLNERGEVTPVGAVSGPAGQWQAFDLPFETPAAAATCHLWIHSFNAAQVDCYLENLRIVE